MSPLVALAHIRLTSGRAAASRQRSQLECGNAKGDIDGNRTLHRDRLERKRARRAADQNVGAHTKAETDVSARSDILTSERAGGHTGRRSEHAPAEHAAGRDADVESHHIERARI